MRLIILLAVILVVGATAGVVAVLGPNTSAQSAEALVDDSLTRLALDGQSGSKHTIEEHCGLDANGTAWAEATGHVTIVQTGATSQVDIRLENARPDTYFTAWLRLKGSGFGGSPLTGGGATPLSPQTDLDRLISFSPFGENSAGSDQLSNGFRTDSKGAGSLSASLDFPIIGGSYNFAMATLETPQGPGVPVAIANPMLPGHGGPFLIRVVSHCSDDVGHGLSPGNREAWFQFP